RSEYIGRGSRPYGQRASRAKARLERLPKARPQESSAFDEVKRAGLPRLRSKSPRGERSAATRPSPGQKIARPDPGRARSNLRRFKRHLGRVRPLSRALNRRRSPSFARPLLLVVFSAQVLDRY